MLFVGPQSTASIIKAYITKGKKIVVSSSVHPIILLLLLLLLLLSSLLLVNHFLEMKWVNHFVTYDATLISTCLTASTCPNIINNYYCPLLDKT